MSALIPQHSIDDLPVPVTNSNGALITVGVSYAVMPVVDGDVPPCPNDAYAWVNAVIAEGRTCIALDGTLLPGRYQVWGRVSAAPLFPKFDCGQFRIF